MAMRRTQKLPALELADPVPAEEVGYARVSTADQDPSMQIAALRKRGIPEDNIFVDHGVSGRRMDRKELRLALKLLRPGWTLVVWKLDRLGRDVKGLIDLAKDFTENNYNLVSITEMLDTKTPIGRFYFHLMASLAQLESDMTQERTRAGMANLRETGFKLGRPMKMTAAVKAAVKRDLANPKLTKPQIAKRNGVAVSTIDLHFPGFRTKLAARARHK